MNRAEAVTLAGRLKALSDPTRLQLVRIIAAQPGISAGDLVRELDRVTQPTVSFHVRVLRKAGLVEVTTDGLYFRHRLIPGAFTQLARVVEGLP